MTALFGRFFSVGSLGVGGIALEASRVLEASGLAGKGY
jgi:hypothetical protein